MSKQTALLGIMDANAFKDATKATVAAGGFMSRFKSRGGGMAALDLALETWTRNCDKSDVSPAQKLSMVAAIEHECARWFRAKEQAGKSTVLSEARGRVIAQVRRACVKATSYLANASKAAASGGLPNRGVLKGLDQGYSHERRDYVARGKQENPFSGTAVKQRNDAEFGAMSYDEFKTAAGAIDAGENRVEFLNRAQRLEYLVTIQNRRLFQDGELMDQLVTKTGDEFIRTWPYAVDRFGNIFARKDPGRAFNHSSFMAGKAVLCAGCIGCYQGRPVSVTNGSGHYAPDSNFLAQFLRILAEEGIDPREIVVQTFDAPQRIMRGSTLLTSPGAASDWPYMDGDGFAQVRVGGRLVPVVQPG